jgi:hypothetical protein
MEHIGASYGVILNDPQLRQVMIRDADRPRRSGLAANGSKLLQRWFAHALHRLVASVDTNPRASDLRPAPAGTAD